MTSPPRGFALTSCLGCFVTVAIGTMLLLRGCTREVRDSDSQSVSQTAKPPYGAATPQGERRFRKTEFVARVTELEPTESIYVSTKRDLICLEGSSCYRFGSFAHPKRGFTLVIPNERVFLRTYSGREKALRESGQTRKAEMLEAKLRMYGLSEFTFPAHVEYLRREQSPPEATVTLEMRGPIQVRVSKTEQNGRRSMQQGFKRYHTEHTSEFSPELGILFSSHELNQEGFALYNVSEEPIPPAKLAVPPGFTELFRDGEPELPALLDGMMPPAYKLTSVKKVGPEVEEMWSRGSDGALIMVEHRTFQSAAAAEKFARDHWEIRTWDGAKFWNQPRFAAFIRKTHLVRVSLLGHDDPQWPLKLAQQVAQKL